MGTELSISEYIYDLTPRKDEIISCNVPPGLHSLPSITVYAQFGGNGADTRRHRHRPLVCKSDGGVQSATSPPTLPIWRNLLISLNCDQGPRQSVQIEGGTCHSGQVARVDGDDLGKWLRRGPIGAYWRGPGRGTSQKSLLMGLVARSLGGGGGGEGRTI